MEFLSKYGLLPKDYELLTKIDNATSRLFGKMKLLNVDSLNISDYNKRYLGDIMRELHMTLSRYAFILSWSVAFAPVPLNEFVFLDYGGGSGLLSLLAKEYEIGTVVYSDIYDVSCRDARVIGESTSGQVEHYVHGDLDEVITFLRENSLSCHGVASNDVIEHIYDIEAFVRKLPALSDGSMTVVMASTANMLNPIARRSITRKQLEAEFKNRQKTWGHKERDSLRAFFEARREIISTYAPDLTDIEIEQLTRVTRGMIEGDIRRTVDSYLSMGELPQEPSHPTNTCDPFTGNWAEHLMDPYHLRDILAEQGFAAQILWGFYGRPRNATKRFLASTLDFVIPMLRNEGIRLAPFFALYGRRSNP